MYEQKENHIPKSGIIYGELGFWFVIVGVIVGIIGLIWYLSGETQVIDPNSFITSLWKGDNIQQIWNEASNGGVRYGHWYLNELSTGDGLALIGISICCLGALAGTLGIFFNMALSKNSKTEKKGKVYLTLSFVMTIILTLSSLGIISMH